MDIRKAAKEEAERIRKEREREDEIRKELGDKRQAEIAEAHIASERERESTTCTRGRSP